MLKIGKAALAAASVALLAVPATAQDEEEPRTTWRVLLIDVADDGMGRWQEIVMDHIIPAQEAAGVPVAQLHWIAANDDWEMIVLNEMPRGMAAFDTHANPERAALFAALVEQEGSEEAVEALFDELNSLEVKTKSFFTHSHP